ncbi:integrase, catalytic region, zinc finger, CCHC-type containing protein [Tanacetum coccineum]|uniref:Integrase, catalytic region, zinc finger, CCHC-type containing protein n=1 Tax=Tanacetum coccineum TaxID=301880 RepID=A0ABQ5CI31_9ASTR
MSQDVLLTVMNSMSLIGETLNMDGNRKESCNLEAELLKSQNAFNDLLKRHSQLEKHCISLECSIQLNQEIFQKRESCDNQNALEILEFFEKNDLKAQLQDKDSTICKLKDMIKSMREKSKVENVKYDYYEIETKNVELENSVAKLLSENERLCNEINHVKQVLKVQFDSIKQTRVCSKEQSDSLIDKLNLKSAENEDLKAQIQDKLRFRTLAPRILQHRKLHIDYLKYTQEQADILRGIVEQAKAAQPLDKELDFTVDVTPKNKDKKVRFAEPITSSSNSKQVESSKTSYSNTPMLSSTRLKCSTSSSKKAKIVESKNASHSKPNHTWDPVLQIFHLLLLCHHRLSRLFPVSGSWMFETHDRESLSAHELCVLGKKARNPPINPKLKTLTRRNYTFLHMDLCGPMHVASINGKRYILVIVDDYSRFTWVRFLRTKDEAPEAIIKCIKNIQVRLNALSVMFKLDNGTEFVNQTLREF